MFNAMDNAVTEGKRIIVNWRCSKYNEIIIECAETFADEFENIKFRIILDDSM